MVSFELPTWKLICCFASVCGVLQLRQFAGLDLPSDQSLTKSTGQRIEVPGPDIKGDNSTRSDEAGKTTLNV